MLVLFAIKLFLLEAQRIRIIIGKDYCECKWETILSQNKYSQLFKRNCLENEIGTSLFILSLKKIN